MSGKYTFAIGLLILTTSLATACSQTNATTTIPPVNNTTVNSQAGTKATNQASQPAPKQTPPTAGAINVTIAGYINHGPMQPTVRAIKDILAKYGDKVNVTWIDISTPEGEEYLKTHHLTAHMNVIINGTTKYQVNGRNGDFTWFEGQQWTKADLDAALSGLINK